MTRQVWIKFPAQFQQQQPFLPPDYALKNRKQLAYGLIYSKLIFGIQYWISECLEAQKKEIQILPNNTAILVMGVKTRNMHVLDLFKCLRWHTLESLVNYHDYCIVRSGQPANLWLIYVQNKAHQVGYADWMYPNSIDDPQRAMLNEGAVTRQRTMDNIN